MTRINYDKCKYKASNFEPRPQSERRYEPLMSTKTSRKVELLKELEVNPRVRDQDKKVMTGLRCYLFSRKWSLKQQRLVTLLIRKYIPEFNPEVTSATT